MEYTTVPELHPNPTQPALYLPQSYPPNFQLYPQNPNPLPSSDPQSSQTFYGVESGVNPPGVNASYAHLATHDYSYAHSHNPVADTTSSYYFDPNSHTWVAYAPVCSALSYLSSFQVFIFCTYTTCLTKINHHYIVKYHSILIFFFSILKC